MRELIVTGRTVEEAVAEACEQLGTRAEDITYEVLELPAKKLFGQSPAKIKVLAPDEAFSVKAILEQEPPERARKPREDRPRDAKRAPRAPFAPTGPDVEITEAELPEAARAPLAYLREVVVGMGAKDISYSFSKNDAGIRFLLDGEDSALIIGRRGDTMEALQYLCSLIGVRGSKDYVKITLDVSGYRGRRDEQLQATARRTADKVLRQHRSQTLPPMNPYERRIVHSAIQGISGVKSESIGEEPNRRIVISQEGRGGYNKHARGRDDRPRERKPTPPTDEKKNDREPTGDPNALYQKIEL